MAHQFETPVPYEELDGALGLSVKQIAKSLGVSTALVADWVSQTFTRSDRRCAAIEDYFQCRTRQGLREQKRWSFAMSVPGVQHMLSSIAEFAHFSVTEFYGFVHGFLTPAELKEWQDEVDRELRQRQAEWRARKEEGEEDLEEEEEEEVPDEEPPVTPPEPEQALAVMPVPVTEDSGLVRGEGFVRPHLIEELGEEGLTSQEVAESIGMRHDNLITLVQKLVQEDSIPSFQEVERVQTNALGKNTHVRTVLLTTEDAKFVVTQSSTKAGRAYCRYLIKCESAVLKAQRLAPEFEARLKAAEDRAGEHEAFMAMIAAQNKVIEALATSIESRNAAFASKTQEPSVAQPTIEKQEQVRQVSTKDPKFMTPEEVAARFRGRVTKKTLANWRWRYKGPAFHKFGGRILYDRASVSEWEEKMLHKTSAPTPINGPRERIYPIPPPPNSKKESPKTS